MALGLSYLPADIRNAGLDAVNPLKIKAGTDIGHYTIGPSAEGKINASVITTNDSRLRNRPIAVDFLGTVKMLDTEKVTVLQKLQNIGVGDNNLIWQLASGQAFQAQMGCKWKFVCDSDMDKDRYIEFTGDCKYLINKGASSEVDWAAITGSPTPGTPNVGDALYTWNTPGLNTNAIFPAGFKQFSIKKATDGSYEDTGVIRNGKLTAELLTVKDSHGRSYGHSIKITVECECMQTSAETAILANEGVAIDYKITLVDATVFTLASTLGIKWEWHNDTDADGVAFIKYSGVGVVLPSAWAGLIS